MKRRLTAVLPFAAASAGAADAAISSFVADGAKARYHNNHVASSSACAPAETAS